MLCGVRAGGRPLADLPFQRGCPSTSPSLPPSLPSPSCLGSLCRPHGVPSRGALAPSLLSRGFRAPSPATVKAWLRGRSLPWLWWRRVTRCPSHRYVGELISDSEADVREEDSYLFDLDNKVLRPEGWHRAQCERAARAHLPTTQRWPPVLRAEGPRPGGWGANLTPGPQPVIPGDSPRLHSPRDSDLQSSREPRVRGEGRGNGCESPLLPGTGERRWLAWRPAWCQVPDAAEATAAPSWFSCGPSFVRCLLAAALRPGWGSGVLCSGPISRGQAAGAYPPTLPAVLGRHAAPARRDPGPQHRRAL